MVDPKARIPWRLRKGASYQASVQIGSMIL